MLESHYYSAGQCGYIYKFKFVDMHALHLMNMRSIKTGELMNLFKEIRCDISEVCPSKDHGDDSMYG